MAVTAQYASVPKSPTVALTTSNANRDGVTGTYATLLTAGASGSRVDRIVIKALAATTAGQVRIFVGTGLIKELYIPTTATPSTTLPSYSTEYVFENGLILAASTVLKLNTEGGTNSFMVTILSGGDF